MAVADDYHRVASAVTTAVALLLHHERFRGQLITNLKDKDKVSVGDDFFIRALKSA